MSFSSCVKPNGSLASSPSASAAPLSDPLSESREEALLPLSFFLERLEVVEKDCRRGLGVAVRKTVSELL